MHDDFNTEKWKNELEKLPKLEELKQALKEFSDTDFSNKPLEEIESAYFKKINIFPGHSGNYPPETIKLLKLIRVRNNVNLEKENIQLINTFSYPPSTFCTCNGRANTPKSPVFYCSDKKTTSFIEVKPKLNELMFMSFWSIQCDREVNFIPILSDNLSYNYYWKRYADKMMKQLIEQTIESGKDKSKELLLLYNTFANWFANEEEPYYKTSWIANKYLYKTNGIDFIVYPSFVKKQSTCAMAFHPNFIDNYLKLNKVISYKTIKIKNNIHEIQIVGIGKPSLTNINWTEPTEEEYDIMKTKPMK